MTWRPIAEQHADGWRDLPGAVCSIGSATRDKRSMTQRTDPATGRTQLLVWWPGEPKAKRVAHSEWTPEELALVREHGAKAQVPGRTKKAVEWRAWALRRKR